MPIWLYLVDTHPPFHKMPPKKRALINPPLLSWARTSVGLTLLEAAKRSRVQADQLEKWEQGQDLPSISQLHRIAAVYARPFTLFYLPKPPQESQPVRDFRRLPPAQREKFGPRLLINFRKAQERRTAALSLMREIGTAPRQFLFQVNRHSKVVNVATSVRSALNVTLETQFSWKSDSATLRGWISAVEALDVLVFQVSRVPLNEMRAFCVSEPFLPVICLNGADQPYGRVFSLAHEFVHLMLNISAVTDLRSGGRGRTEVDDLERFCNAVAAEFLVPAESLRTEDLFISRNPQEAWDIEDLRPLSTKYGVSREVLARRLLDLRMIDHRSFAHIQNQIETLYKRAQKTISTSEGGPSYYRVQARNLGRLFTTLVLGAYYQDAITLYEASNHLGVQADRIGKIEAEIIGKPTPRYSQ